MAANRKIVRPGDIQVWPNFVLIFGQRVERPSYVSLSAWIDFWEAFEG
jgi:hypothetical protein